MKQNLELIQTILDTGCWQDNRTNTRTLSIPGAMLRFNMQDGYPAATTKKLAFKSVIGELCAFLRASTSAADFRAMGSKVWDQNANENKDWLANSFREEIDFLGPVYGFQWRKWPGYKLLDKEKTSQIEQAVNGGFKIIGEIEELGVKKVLLYKAIDQLRQCVDTIVKDPGSRRILFHAWNPAVLDEIALPACHLLYQFIPNATTKELSLCMYLRSSDVGLGLNFNEASAAALLELVSRLTGYKAKFLTIFIGDAHIYENHMDMVKEQLTREPHTLPRLKISERIPSFAETGRYEPEWLDKVEPSDFSLEGYEHHAPLTAPMAV